MSLRERKMFSLTNDLQQFSIFVKLHDPGVAVPVGNEEDSGLVGNGHIHDFHDARIDHVIVTAVLQNELQTSHDRNETMQLFPTEK